MESNSNREEQQNHDNVANHRRPNKLCNCTTLTVAAWILVSTLSIAALLHSYFFIKLPDFSEPEQGFETRGTVLSGRWNALYSLYLASRTSGYLTDNPNGHRVKSRMQENLRSWLKSDTKGKVHTHTILLRPENTTTDFPLLSSNESTPADKDYIDQMNDNFQYESETDYFCAQPTEYHSRLIFSNIQEGADMWKNEIVKELCNLEETLSDLYKNLCETRHEEEKCCPAWSLPTYIRLFANESSCHNITQHHLDSLLDLISYCSPFFHSLALECIPGEACHAPYRCLYLNIVRSLMDFVLDTNTFPPNGSQQSRVRYIQIVLPIAKSTKTYQFYMQLQNVLSSSKFQYIKLVGMDLGLKNYLFDILIISDATKLGLASLLVITILLFAFIRSITILLIGLTNAFFSFIVTYWIYCQLLGSDRFQFLNILAVLLLLAIGTDDVLFISHAWGEKSDKTLIERLKSLSKLWISVTATSVTTSFAMFAARLSSVTSIALFSMFAGSLMLVHLIFTIIWLVPSMILLEKIDLHFSICTGLIVPVTNFFRQIDSNLKAGLLWAVTKLSVFCIFVTFFTALLAAFVIFVNPGLQTPESKTFPLFSHNHPFERSESDFGESFWYLKRQHSSSRILPLTWVWGVFPIDLRDPLDPYDKGNASQLIFDNTFDISNQKAQMFLFKFCQQLKHQSFYKSTLGLLLSNCFIDTLYNYMNRKCTSDISQIKRKPCCDSSRFPYSPKVFSTCLQKAMKDLHDTPVDFFTPGIAGPKYDKRINLTDTVAPKAIVIQYDSTFEFSTSYKDMHTFFMQVENWTRSFMQTAPPTMKNGFFVSYLEFYDLQFHLIYESISSVIIAGSICAIVLYCATRNTIITLIASGCVVTIVISALATLTLLGWRLNVLESLVITMASGLSVDFILHFAIKYSAHLERDIRIRYLIFTNASPVAMATLTTLSAGLILSTSTVLALSQIGTFIAILSTSSFLFSNFAFLSLLFQFGPSFETDYEYCKSIWASPEIHDEVNVTSQALLSESNSVTLTGLPPLSPELHEMENMSPTFLEDPFAPPRTSVFDAPTPMEITTESQHNICNNTKTSAALASLVPLL